MSGCLSWRTDVPWDIKGKGEEKKMIEEKKFVGNWRAHCHKCGRFVGKDGFIDIFYDESMSGYEDGGYSLCAACLKKSKGVRE